MQKVKNKFFWKKLIFWCTYAFFEHFCVLKDIEHLLYFLHFDALNSIKHHNREKKGAQKLFLNNNIIVFVYFSESNISEMKKKSDLVHLSQTQEKKV